MDPKTNKKKLYLHIGLPKTGSTSIQKMLVDNQEQLLKAGVFIPFLGWRYKYKNYTFHSNLDFEIRNTNQFDPKKGTWKTLIAAYQNSNCQKAIVSWEGLGDFSESEIIALHKLIRDHFDTTIICYLRRQDRLINSNYCQQVKLGIKHYNFKTFLHLPHKPYKYNFKLFLDMWSDIFSREKVIARIFEKEQFLNGNLIDDFLDACGISPDIIEEGKNDIKNSAPNRTSILAALEVSRILEDSYESNVIEEKERIIKKVVKDLNEIKDDVRFFGFKNKEAKAFLSKYNEANSAVAREYFSWENGRLFLDNKPLNPNENSSDDKVLSFEQLKVIESIIAEEADQIRRSKKIIFKIYCELKRMVPKKVKKVLFYRLHGSSHGRFDPLRKKAHYIAPGR